jgi:DNA-binding Lrp family transcriptional regulator
VREITLTKNDRKVLHFLLDNARISDSAIAKKLKISSQAVGKIRKKLEHSVITSYTANLNYAKLGIQIFAIALAKLTPEGLDKGELEIERKLLDDPNIIHIYRLPNQNTTHIIMYGFRDMNDLDSYFHSPKKKLELHNFIENKEIFTFSHNSLIKSSPSQLFKKIISRFDDEETHPIEAFENFKRRLER